MILAILKQTYQLDRFVMKICHFSHHFKHYFELYTITSNSAEFLIKFMLIALRSLCDHRFCYESDRTVSPWILYIELFSTASSPFFTSFLLLRKHLHNDFELNTSSE